MMTILHGESVVESRQELGNLRAQSKGEEIISLEGGKLTLTELKQVLEAKSLFGQEKLVILENFLAGKRKSKEKENIIEYLTKEEPVVDLIFWEDQEIEKSLLRLFPRAKIRIFKLDPLLFRFLESIRPGNGQEMIEFFRKVFTSEEINLVFYMICRQFRLLLFLKMGDDKGLEELDRLAPWQKTKIVRQSRYFSWEKLSKSYHDLLEIDFQEKAGFSSYPLQQALELFLANL